MPLFLMRPTTKIYEIAHKRRNFEPTKYPREKTLDPRNTYEKKFGTHEIPTRKNLGPMKYPREKLWDPRNTHKGTIGQWHWTHETHDGTQTTKFSTLLLYLFYKDSTGNLKTL